MKTNSQILLSDRLYLGDIDGDGLDELIEVDGRHLYIFKANSEHTPVLEHVFPSPVRRLIIGDFVTRGREKGKDQILAILADGSIRGYAISNDKKELWWWFTQPSFIRTNQHYIVGDFDGDGADEIMVYSPTKGSISIYEKKPRGLLVRKTNFTLGNLRKYDRKNKLLIAGEFGQANNRADLLVINRRAGQVTRFDSATDDRGFMTFWWAFTSKSRLFSSRDDLCVANIDGGIRDGLVVRNYATGKYRLYKLEYNNGNLLTVSGVTVGQLPIKPKSGQIIAAKVRDNRFRRERGGTRRDDILFFNDKSLEFVRTDARFDRSRNRLIYWWAYSSNLLLEPLVRPKKMAWAVMLCRFKGMRGNAAIEKFFREMFTPGSGGMIEYWHDATLGAVDIGASKVFGWIELDIKRRDAAGMRRDQLIDAAIAATRKAGLNPERGFHSQIAVFTHNFSRSGAPANVNWRDPIWGQYWIDGSADSRGRVSAPPHGQSGSFIAHEMGHGKGLSHDLGSDLRTPYGDPNSIMSAMRVRSFQQPKWNKAFGPAISFPQLYIKNWMYRRRIYTAPNSWRSGSGKLDLKMAPLSDRRQDAPLGVILGMGRWSYYLEYMTPTGWNQGLLRSRLIIRRRVGNTAAFLGEIILPTTLGRTSSWTEPSGNVTFQVENIRADQRHIRVKVKKER